MAALRIPLVPTDKIIQLLSWSIRHTHFTELRSFAECHICHEPFLSGSHPERPVTLPCGHIFGEGCILKWVSPLPDHRGKNSCPLCREPIFEARALKLLTTHPTYSEDLFLFLQMWELADLFYNAPFWLHELSIHAPQMVALLLFLAYNCDAEKLGDDSAARRTATVRVSRQLLTARDRKDFNASITAFEDYLFEEVLEILHKLWRAGRTTVRIFVFCRMLILALWLLFEIIGLAVYAFTLALGLAVPLFQR